MEMAELVAAYARLEARLSAVETQMEQQLEKQDDLLKGYYSNKLMIEGLHKDVNNGLSSRIKDTQEKVNALFKKFESLSLCIQSDQKQDAVDKAAAEASIYTWLGNSFKKALENIVMIIAIAVLVKALPLLSRLDLSSFMK